jgi:hypothetical protein
MAGRIKLSRLKGRMKKITLWIPAADQPKWTCVESWWKLQPPPDTKIELYRSGMNNVRYSWNKAVMDFLDTKNEWLLSVHNDVVLAPETLTRLLSWDKPLISALVFMRTSPILPHIWKIYDEDATQRMVMRINDTREWFYKHKDWIRMGAFVMNPRPDDALTEITFTSTSCTLIHRSVLEAMRPMVEDIWFKWDDEYNGGGEDRNFFVNAKSAGFPAYVDRSCVVGHLTGDIPASSWDFIAWDSISTFEETGELTTP